MTVQKKGCDEWGTAVRTSGATEISQDAVVFESRLHFTQETFTIFLQKIQKILRKQKISSSHAYRREAENSPKPTMKTKYNTAWTEQLQEYLCSLSQNMSRAMRALIRANAL